MTRGYACVVNGENVLNVTYLPSDGFAECKKMLYMWKNDNLKGAIAQDQERIRTVYGENDPTRNFELGWILNDMPSEVGFIMDVTKDICTIYKYGKCKLSVSKNNIEKFLDMSDEDFREIFK